MDTNHLSTPPTQYEIQKWWFGRGHVVEMVANGGGARGRGSPDHHRHSSYNGLSLTMGKDERATLKRDHRRVYSQGQLSGCQWTQQEEEDRGPVEGGERPQQGERQGEGRGNGFIEKTHALEAGEGRTRHQRSWSLESRQGHRLSSCVQVLERKRESDYSVGSGETLIGTSSPLSSPTTKRFPQGGLSEPRKRRASALYLLPPTTSQTSKLPPTFNILPASTTIPNQYQTNISTPIRLLSCNDVTMEDQSKGSKAFRPFKRSKNSGKSPLGPKSFTCNVSIHTDLAQYPCKSILCSHNSNTSIHWVDLQMNSYSKGVTRGTTIQAPTQEVIGFTWPTVSVNPVPTQSKTT